MYQTVFYYTIYVIGCVMCTIRFWIINEIENMPIIHKHTIYSFYFASQISINAWFCVLFLAKHCSSDHDIHHTAYHSIAPCTRLIYYTDNQNENTAMNDILWEKTQWLGRKMYKTSQRIVLTSRECVFARTMRMYSEANNTFEIDKH